LKGTTLKTSIGDILLKEVYPVCSIYTDIDNYECDYGYYISSGIDGICKMYQLDDRSSGERFYHEMYFSLDIGSSIGKNVYQ
jgi:hypothetical protein